MSGELGEAVPATSMWRRIAEPFSMRGLTGVAFWGFCLLSAAATGMGFADLQAASRDTPELPPLELAFTIATTLFVVCTMVVALYTAIRREGVILRIVSGFFYLLFAVWSVGFGYGFFWKEFAGKEFTQAQFGRVIDDISASLDRTQGALATAGQATRSAAELAKRRAEAEALSGRTCANRPGSTPGEGPLMRARFAFAEGSARLADDVESAWIKPLEARRVQLAQRVEALKTRQVPVNASLPAGERALLGRLANARELASNDRRVLFIGVHAEAESFAQAANSLRQRHAGAFADRLALLAAEVGPDPANAGAADPARAADPGYCWDVVLHQQMTTAAQSLRGMEDVTAPPFEFLEGPKATRAAFFGLVSWIGSLAGLPPPQGVAIPFGQKEFLALFASLAVDLGILFLTLLRDLPRGTAPKRKGKAAQGSGTPTPPHLASILEP